MSIVADTPTMTKIRKARINLLFSHPFYGNLIMKLPVVDATESGWCPTMAVDGRYIYYNSKFVDELTVEELIFVFCHEVLHVVYDHLGRRSHREPSWWNMATDYVINGNLVKDRIGTMPTKKVEAKDADGKSVQRVGLYEEKYVGWTSEAVYDDLEKNKATCKMTLDVHLELGKDGQDSKGEKQNRGMGIPIEVSEEEMKKIREELKNKILEAASVSKGNLPSGIARLIDELVEPKINWRDFIAETIQSQLTSDYAWHKPNRRHQGGDVIFPSLIKEEEIEVEISIDQSGSISADMARDFLSEIWGITEQYAHYTVAVSTFDTKLYNRQVFTNENGEDMLHYEPKGGGGTDIGVVWSYLKKKDIVPKLLIVFTDLEDSYHGDPDYCHTIFVIHNPWNKNILPQHGQWVRYDPTQGVVETGQVE